MGKEGDVEGPGKWSAPGPALALSGPDLSQLLNAYIICHLTLVMFLHYLTLHKNQKFTSSSFRYCEWLRKEPIWHASLIFWHTYIKWLVNLSSQMQSCAVSALGYAINLLAINNYHAIRIA